MVPLSLKRPSVTGSKRRIRVSDFLISGEQGSSPSNPSTVTLCPSKLCLPLMTHLIWTLAGKVVAPEGGGNVWSIVPVTTWDGRSSILRGQLLRHSGRLRYLKRIRASTCKPMMHSIRKKEQIVEVDAILRHQFRDNISKTEKKSVGEPVQLILHEKRRLYCRQRKEDLHCFTHLLEECRSNDQVEGLEEDQVLYLKEHFLQLKSEEKVTQLDRWSCLILHVVSKTHENEPNFCKICQKYFRYGDSKGTLGTLDSAQNKRDLKLETVLNPLGINPLKE